MPPGLPPSANKGPCAHYVLNPTLDFSRENGSWQLSFGAYKVIL